MSTRDEVASDLGLHRYAGVETPRISCHRASRGNRPGLGGAVDLSDLGPEAFLGTGCQFQRQRGSGGNDRFTAAITPIQPASQTGLQVDRCSHQDITARGGAERLADVFGKEWTAADESDTAGERQHDGQLQAEHMLRWHGCDQVPLFPIIHAKTFGGEFDSGLQFPPPLMNRCGFTGGPGSEQHDRHMICIYLHFRVRNRQFAVSIGQV